MIWKGEGFKIAIVEKPIWEKQKQNTSWRVFRDDSVINNRKKLGADMSPQTSTVIVNGLTQFICQRIKSSQAVLTWVLSQPQTSCQAKASSADFLSCSKVLYSVSLFSYYIFVCSPAVSASDMSDWSTPKYNSSLRSVVFYNYIQSILRPQILLITNRH